MRQPPLLAILAIVVLSPSLHAATPAEELARKPDEWFRGEKGREALACVLSWQSERGDWPKNTDTTKKWYTGDRGKLAGTFDNGATTGELRVLGRAFRVTGDARYEQAFLAGFDHVLKAQYPHGGWPQFFPPGNGYHRHVTYNDGTMIRLLEFLRDAGRAEDFAWLDDDRRTAAGEAVGRGIECIVKCQVVVNGKPTVWCAQHDAETLAPAAARSYEHPSLSGAESAGILIFLMSVENPSPEVVRAVNAGAAWFESVRIEGFRYRKSGTEPNLVKDSDARPLWARFYEIETNRPIFSDRDGVVKYDLAQIGSERRGGYSWYGNWGEGVAKAHSNRARR